MSAGRHLEAREAELAVLGAILLDNTALDRVAEVLNADDFYTPRHRTVYGRMMSLAEANQPIDTVTIATALERDDELEGVGGMEYLLSLDQVSATAANVDHHAKLVHDLAEIRRLITACTEIIAKSQGGDYEDTES